MSRGRPPSGGFFLKWSSSDMTNTMNVRMDQRTWSLEPSDLNTTQSFLFGGAALLGSKTRTDKQTNRQTNKRTRARVYEKNSRGVKSSSSSSLALVPVLFEAEAWIFLLGAKEQQQSFSWMTTFSTRYKLCQCLMMNRIYTRRAFFWCHWFHQKINHGLHNDSSKSSAHT